VGYAQSSLECKKQETENQILQVFPIKRKDELLPMKLNLRPVKEAVSHIVNEPSPRLKEVPLSIPLSRNSEHYHCIHHPSVPESLKSLCQNKYSKLI
jgi:hypothetical protein